MPLAQVVRGDREDRALAATRCPRVERGVIAQDFDFRGILTANKLSEFRENRPGRGVAWTIRTKLLALTRKSR
jgi:hypothetical protein